jgi:chromosomal replication initiation ATPase DnaA
VTIQFASLPARSNGPARSREGIPHAIHQIDSPARQVCDALVQRIGRHKFDMWFAHATMNVHGRCLEISTDNQFVANWIGSNFAGELRSVAREALGRDIELDVKLRPGAESDAESRELGASREFAHGCRSKRSRRSACTGDRWARAPVSARFQARRHGHLAPP